MNGNNEPSIDHLVIDLIEAKASVAEAKQRADKIEDKIVQFLGNKPEGIQHFKGENYILSTTGKITRSLDDTDISLMREKLGDRIFREIIEVAPKLNLKNFKALAVSDPERYRTACGFITSKPAKTSVSFKANKKD
tara:strand:+ start:3014 stop:3421 length:408 start_codon:yes stop_codon:yes gene_type:complete